ncbi:MAG: hypothetical protein MN733_11875, partial [Nitrososphaera sp.]|nr:hypothetical protein [Nitrososphaera sp.]
LFQTIRTDFGLMQSTLDSMLVRAEAVESMGPHSAPYNVAMIDLHNTANGIETSLLEALPYLYLSFGNLVFSAVWVAAIISVFAAMRKVNSRTKTRYEQQYNAV